MVESMNNPRAIMSAAFLMSTANDTLQPRTAHEDHQRPRLLLKCALGKCEKNAIYFEKVL